MTIENMKDDGRVMTAAAARLVAGLDPAAKARAALIGELNQGYITSDQHHRVNRAVSELIENAAATFSGEAGKRRALFIVGESGSGKTTALAHTLLNRPELQSYIDDNGFEVRPLIHFEPPKPSGMKLFARKMLEAAGYPLADNVRHSEYELFELAKRVLKARRVMFLYIDEMQHVLRGTKATEIVNVADTLKSLLQIEGWPLHLVVAGMPVLASFIEQETQLRNRSLVVSLEQVTFPADVKRVRVIAAGVIRNHANLKVSDTMLTDEFLHRLIRASDHGFGTIIQMVRAACALTIRQSKTSVELTHFADAYSLVTGCQPHHNMFLSPDWQALAPATTLADITAKQKSADRIAKIAQRKHKSEGQ